MSDHPPLRVLLVEDSESDALLIVRELSRAYTVAWRRVETERELRAALNEGWDIVLADHALPQMNAPLALRTVQEVAPQTPVVIVSGAITEADAVAQLSLGAAAYYFKDHLDGLPLGVRHAIADARGLDQMILGLTTMLEFRDKETEGHSVRVTTMTVALAKLLDITGAALLHIKRGAQLHDIGKMGIPDRILHKQGPLTFDEWEIMKRHPTDAYLALSGVEALQHALDVVYCHHEHYDGSGYPRGLAGEDIPYSARIFAVVDVWDALRNDRPYKVAMDVPAALGELRRVAGTILDPAIVARFCQAIVSGAL